MQAPIEKLRERLRANVEPVLIAAEAAELTEAVLDAVCRSLHTMSSRADFRQQLIKDNPNAHCWVCELPIAMQLHHGDPAAFSVDHFIPRCEGGAMLGYSNLRPAHRYCNAARHVEHWTKRRLHSYVRFLMDVAERAGLEMDKVPDFVWKLRLRGSKSSRKRNRKRAA